MDHQVNLHRLTRTRAGLVDRALTAPELGYKTKHFTVDTADVVRVLEDLDRGCICAFDLGGELVADCGGGIVGVFAVGLVVSQLDSRGIGDDGVANAETCHGDGEGLFLH